MKINIIYTLYYYKILIIKLILNYILIYKNLKIKKKKKKKNKKKKKKKKKKNYRLSLIKEINQ